MAEARGDIVLGYENMPLVSLEEAVEPLISILPKVRNYAYVAKQSCKSVPEDGLTRDESASIMLYTMEWEPLDECLSVVLNSTLLSESRHQIKPWFLYLKLFLNAFSRLPSTHRTVYRGIKLDLMKQLPVGKTVVWWSFSSCTSSIEVLEKEQFLGKTGVRTIFTIDCDSGKDIRRHSSHKSEEILLPPARQFRVVASLSPAPNLCMIQLKEIESPPPLLPSVVYNSDLKQPSLDKQWLDVQYHKNGTIKKPAEVEKTMKDPPAVVDAKILNAIQGSMAGMALGDALGAHVTFQTRHHLMQNPVTDFQGGGLWQLNKGEFTGATSMALCLANSLVVHRDFIPYDQLVRYKWWFENGYMSSTGKCFYIGEPTKQSLLEFELRQKKFASKNGISSYEIDYFSDPQLLKQFNVYCSEEGVTSAGALMRLASVPLFFHRNAKHAVEFSGISGRITHGDQSVYDACRYYGALIVATLQGETKEQLLDNNFYLKHIEWFNDKPLHSSIEMIAQGSYKRKGGYNDGIRGKGNIASALEAALWAFWVDGGSFMIGTLAAVNLGDNTSATAAIYGQLAGAYYGYNNLPKHWLDQVYGLRFIQCLSKWIVYEGQRWQPNKSLASIITAPTPQSQSNTTTGSSNTEESDSNVKMATTSPLYNACRDNDISLVEHYLKTMSLEEINQIEPNGSTALHVASYRGHEKIVELLLEKGACLTTKNKYNLTPLEEAKTDNIKQIIRRRRHTTRFVSESVEWIIATNDADYQAYEYSKKIEIYGKDSHFHQFISYIKTNYLEKDLQNIDRVDEIKQYFDKAINKKDPVYLLKAYTAETGFYSTLNVHLAQLKLENLTSQENLSRAYYIGIIAYHPKFETLYYTGIVYRGMMITNDDVKYYKKGTRILTKTFSSSTKQRSIALSFTDKNRGGGDRLSTICTYELRNLRTALDIEHISEYSYEKEVLILPYSAFKIIDIKQNEDGIPKIEIKLKECEPWE